MIPLEKLRAIKTLYTHASCPDGIASALIVKDALPDVRVHFVKYGSEEHRNLSAEPGLLFCDFSPPRERAAEFVAAGTIVLDHHTRDVVEPYGELGVFGDNEKLECGAWLAYEHVWLPVSHAKMNERVFHSKTPVDEITPRQVDEVLKRFTTPLRENEVRAFAELAAVRDTWKKDEPRWQLACEQAAALIFWEEDVTLDQMLEGWSRLGKKLVAKHLDLARTSIAESVRFTSARGTRVILFQGVSATSDAAEILEKEHEPLQNKATTPDEKFLALYLQAYRLPQPDLVVGFHYRHETCVGCGGSAQSDDPLCPQCRGSGGRLVLQFSTRSHAGFDCQALARAHGGNGHKAAAGFTIDQSAEIGSNPYAVFRLLLDEWEGDQ